MSNLAPIALFCFNRPNHLNETLKYLKKNDLINKSRIYIFSDAPKEKKDFKKVEMVRSIIKNLIGFKEKIIFFRKNNYGLAKNIISGINYVFRKENKIIVLEDDLIVDKFFLEYMNKNLDYYKQNHNVASIHGYIYPIDKKNLDNSFFIKGADCWGWGTWKRAWQKFENNPNKLINKIKKYNLISEFNFNNSKDYFFMLNKNLRSKKKSWAIQWYASAFLGNMLTLYPKQTYVRNIGLDGSGENTNLEYNYNSNFSKKKKIFKIKNIKENIIARQKFESFFRTSERNFFQKIIFKIFNV